ncbi:MAG: hypothetical protein JXA33_02275 [Anaerolineae bacterium]|nr:hypothetical protein [Anaerolineae bacterium]
MLPMILLYTGVIVVFSIGLYLMSRWAASYVERIVQGRLDAMEELVNRKHIPEVWLRPFQEQLTKYQEKGADEKKIARVKQKAQKRCLRRIDELIKYVENVNFTDGGETKAALLNTLHTYQETWSAPNVDVLAQNEITAEVEIEEVSPAAVTSEI